MSIQNGFYIIILAVSFSVLADSPKLQVLMGSSLPSIKISGENIVKSYRHRAFSKKYSGNQTLVLDCKKKLNSSSWKQGPLLASLTSSQGVLEWKKNKYQGEFFVMRSENKPGCDLVHEVSLETYISTLVAKEMHRDWPLEALKAQAVAARTYALSKQMERKLDDSGQMFDLENSEKDQVSGSMSDINANTYQAAYLTQGEVLLNNQGKLVPIYYHSKCGGKTHLPEQVWGNFVAGYQPVVCPFCQNHGQATWSSHISVKKVTNIFLNLAWPSNPYRKVTFPVNALSIFANNKEDQTVFFKFKNQIFKIRKAQIRKGIGRQQIFSNNFTVEIANGSVIFKGDGLGHGVGMCQIGALELAKRGYNYRQILSFYYPNFQLKNYY